MVETVYVMTPGVSVNQDGGLLVLEQNHKVLRELPMATVGTLVVGRTTQLSTQVMYSLVQQGSLIQFVDHAYRLVGTLGDEKTSLSKLLWQTRYFQDESFALMGAQYIVQKKIQAQISILEQYSKTKALPNYDFVRKTLYGLLKRVGKVRTIDGLRGMEGLASKTYFSVWGACLSEPWEFTSRKRHPSPDPVNALLSYGYSFLEREVRSCLLTSGLDVRIGLLHSTNNRKDSLVYDLMDLVRQEVMDRFILKVLNRHMVNDTDFEITERGCFMSKDAQKKWVSLYESYMTTTVKRFGGMSPRQWIQQCVREFMSYLDQISDIHADMEVKTVS